MYAKTSVGSRSTRRDIFSHLSLTGNIYRNIKENINK